MKLSRFLTKDAAGHAGIFLALIAIYTWLAKANLTIDGGNFIGTHGFVKWGGQAHMYHLLYNRFLYAFVALGKPLGFEAQASGTFLSALFMALAVALFALLLRRYGVGWPAVAVTGLLFGLNDATIENATSVEIYGCAVFAVVVSMHAFKSEADRPTRRGAVALFAASVLVLLFHVGFAFWILALYLALAWKERANRRAIPIRIAQGAGTAVALVIAMALHGVIGEHGASHTREFFDKFWTDETALDRLLSFIEAPLFGFALHAGLLLFPACFGWGMARARFPAEAALMLIATFVFLGYYSFWTIDWGTFYLPVQLIWGLFAAFAIDAVLRSQRAADATILITGAGIYFVVFIFLGASTGMYSHTPEKWTLALSYWLYCIMSAALGSGSAAVGMRFTSGQPILSLRWAPLAIYAAMTLTFAGVAYLPRALEESKPDKSNEMLQAFKQVSPEDALFISSTPLHRSWAESGRLSIPAFEFLNDAKDWEPTQRMIADWIRASARPGGRPLYMDMITHTRRREIWRRYPTIEIPLEKLAFEPVASGEFLFYRVKFADPKNAETYAALEDFYDAENWDGILVRWTRKVARLPFEPLGPTLIVRYYIANETVSDENPLAVELEIKDGPEQTFTHTAQGYFEQKLDISDLKKPLLELKLEVDRTFRAPDGRDLGIALYPLDFE